MAMEISGNYGNYYNSAVYNTAENGKTKSEKAKSSEDKVQEYYEKLCKKFPKIKINASGGIASSSRNNIVLNLSKDCLKKMTADPEFAKKIENDISGIPSAHKEMYTKAERDGIEIYDFSVRINPDGSMQCSGSARTSGTKQSSSLLSTDRKKERLEKRRKEKEEMEARMEEKRREKAEFKERLKERRLERG